MPTAISEYIRNFKNPALDKCILIGYCEEPADEVLNRMINNYNISGYLRPGTGPFCFNSIRGLYIHEVRFDYYVSPVYRLVSLLSNDRFKEYHYPKNVYNESTYKVLLKSLKCRIDAIKEAIPNATFRVDRMYLEKAVEDYKDLYIFLSEHAHDTFE